ncbi:MAG: OmpA family protein, partial [Desulfobacteraceae bacterium]|nr:OmpA family protein [Desulfobacteraceae bacterium]
QFETSMYTSKVDNFIVVFDASSSMGDCYNKIKKFEIAKALVERMNQTIPEMNQTAGLRSFGHHDDVSKEQTVLLYGMEKYSTQNFAEKFKQVSKPGGFSPLWRSLDANQTDLEGLPGVHTAVIIITDGWELPGDVIASAQALKDKYGSSICFYPILVGDDAEGEVLMNEVAQIGECGFYSRADDLLSGPGMAAFVEKVFLEKKPEVKKAAPVARKDTDRDGVYDDEDQCPGTPYGARVNEKGCWIIDHVLFDFDKSVIKPGAYPMLDEVVGIIEKNPGLKVELQGHTDNIGTKEYNIGLSKRRASAVKKYLVGKGIATDRLAIDGYGYSNPVALNGTKEGRAMNRRTELHPF